jgi:hypothetical protein
LSEVRAPIRIRTGSDSVLIPGKRGFARGSKIGAIMKRWKEELISEHRELIKRIEALDAFRNTDEHHKLERAERDRLTAQLMFMRGYATMLKSRIDT